MARISTAGRNIDNAPFAASSGIKAARSGSGFEGSTAPGPFLPPSPWRLPALELPQSPLAQSIHAGLASLPQFADMVNGISNVSLSRIEQGIASFLASLDPAPVAAPPGGSSELYPWLLAGVVTALACELARRQFSKPSLTVPSNWPQFRSLRGRRLKSMRMDDAPLDSLLQRLCTGDRAAAEQVFLAFEPYLRTAVRRQLPAPYRAKFDSADILQSVWADALRGFREAGWRFVDADHLRGFLFVAMRNRMIDRVRQHQGALGREQPLDEHAPPAKQPRPSEMAQAADVWNQIQAQCPAEHRPILELKRQGFTLAEIGERVGLHPDSVRRILRTLARQLAFGTPPGGSNES